MRGFFSTILFLVMEFSLQARITITFDNNISVVTQTGMSKVPGCSHGVILTAAEEKYHGPYHRLAQRLRTEIGQIPVKGILEVKLLSPGNEVVPASVRVEFKGSTTFIRTFSLLPDANINPAMQEITRLITTTPPAAAVSARR